MTRPPSEPSKGGAILEWAREVTRYLRAITPRDGAEIIYDRGPGGTKPIIRPRRGKTAATPAAPFEARSAGVDGTSALINVKIGTFNDSEPDVPGDTGDGPDGWWQLSISASSTLYAYLHGTMAEDGTVSDQEMLTSGSPPTTDPGDPGAGDPPPDVYRKLFKVVTDADGAVTELTQYTTGAQQAFAVVTGWACETIQKNVYWLP